MKLYNKTISLFIQNICQCTKNEQEDCAYKNSGLSSICFDKIIVEYCFEMVLALIVLLCFIVIVIIASSCAHTHMRRRRRRSDYRKWYYRFIGKRGYIQHVLWHTTWLIVYCTTLLYYYSYYWKTKNVVKDRIIDNHYDIINTSLDVCTFNEKIDVFASLDPIELFYPRKQFLWLKI